MYIFQEINSMRCMQFNQIETNESYCISPKSKHKINLLYELNQSLIHFNQMRGLPLKSYIKFSSFCLPFTSNDTLFPENSIIRITFWISKLWNLKLYHIVLLSAVFLFINRRTCVIRQSPATDKWTEQMQGSWWLCIWYHMCSPPYRGKG